MLAYITFIALLNLGLGYGLAVYFKTGALPTLRKVRTSAEAVGDSADATFDYSQDQQEETSIKRMVAEREPKRASNQPNDPATGLATRDHVDKLLAELTAAADPAASPNSVVLVELDGADAADDSSIDRLLSGVASTVRGLLSETHTAARYGEHQLMVLLPGDDEAATTLAEQVRQRIETTQYVADDQPRQATVSCALTQLSADDSVDELLKTLQETLLEAKQSGGNRTYMHDGIAPSPVATPELNFSVQKCAI
jgi:diguanylate cyclase (GGDEF)-like protein